MVVEKKEMGSEVLKRFSLPLFRVSVRRDCERREYAFLRYMEVMRPTDTVEERPGVEAEDHLSVGRCLF